MQFSIDLDCVKYLSFDCYGTLVDWEQGILNALTTQTPEFRELSAATILQSFAKWESKIESEKFLPYRQVLTRVDTEIHKEFSLPPIENEQLADSVGTWEPFPDTAPALTRLQEKFKLAILSNVDNDMFQCTQSIIGVDFDFVCTAQDIGSYKPDLKNFRYLLEKLKCQKSEILHIAQSIYHDHVPAQKLGLQSIWVDRPSRVPGTGATLPTSLQPRYRVTSMQELADLLLKTD